MVARGDMGVEIDYAEIPSIQKHLIDHAMQMGKICITATQMLDSMIVTPRPTRAEITVPLCCPAKLPQASIR